MVFPCLLHRSISANKGMQYLLRTYAVVSTSMILKICMPHKHDQLVLLEFFACFFFPLRPEVLYFFFKKPGFHMSNRMSI